MSYQISLAGRPQTAPRLSWHKSIEVDGMTVDVTPAPGRTYTRETWPPRGRGRGESLTSPRRIEAKLRAGQVISLRRKGYTWQAIAARVGFADASGAYRAYQRAADRLAWDEQRKQELRGGARDC